MANELLIRINADAKNAQKAFDDLRKQTEDLDETLKTIGTASAIAFAALTAEIVLSVRAFEESEQAARKLNQTLQNQGIYTKELADEYKKFAKATEEKTGIDDDQIINSQAIAQSYLGQTKITQELTNAIADYSEVLGGDLNGAAEQIAKTIGTSKNAFKDQGLVLSATATEAERYQKVLDFVQLRSGGFAEAANKGVGSIRGLRTAFGNFQEEIGRNFAPIIESVTRVLTNFFQYINEHPDIAKFAAAVVAGAAAMTALAAAIPAIIIGLSAFKAALAAVGVTANIALAGIPVAVGLVVTALGLLILYWQDVSRVTLASLKFLGTLVAEVFGGIAKIIKSAFTFDPADLQRGIDQFVGSLKKAQESYTTYNESQLEETKKSEEKQDATRKKFADKQAADRAAHQARLIAIDRAEREKILLETENASEQLISLKDKEIAILRQMDDEKHSRDLELLQAQLEETRALQDEQLRQDIERRVEYEDENRALTDEFYGLRGEQLSELNEKERAELEQGLLTQKEAEKKVREDMLKDRIDSNNRFKQEQIKYGAAIATIDRAVQSQQVQAAKSVSGELVALAQSKNENLKAIGKAAAIAQITIGTAESAVNIARSVASVIPFPFNVPIIATLVAARIAFGAEQIANVQAAQDGGLVEGGISGRDSVPFLLEPGELVVPRRNFNDVVGAVSGGGNEELLEVMRSIDQKISTPQTTVIQGDIHADESYVDSMLRKINDAIEYRNGKLLGVNT